MTGAVSENVEQIDLKTRGINFHLPGFSTPTIVGPFDYTDARAYASFSVFDYSLRKSYRAAKEGERAAQLSFKDARDLVVQSVANAYLLVIAGSSRVQALRAQVETDQAIYDRTADQKRAGTAAAIDVLRAHVRFEQEQQQLIAQENQVAKDKLALGRVIGLPPGQQFTIADTEPYSALAAMTPDRGRAQGLRTARRFPERQASVRAAENSVERRSRRALSEPRRRRRITALSERRSTIPTERSRFRLSRSSTFSTAGESVATSFRPGRL